MNKFGLSGKILAAVSLVGALALAGCGGTAEKQSDEKVVEQSATAQSAQSAADNVQSTAAENGANAAAIGEIGDPARIVLAAHTAESLVEGSVAVEVEQEHRDSRLEVKVYTADGESYKVLLSADGKEVISGPDQKRSDDHSRAKHIQRLEAKKVTLEGAVGLLDKEFPGSSIHEIELDSDDGALVWKIEFVDNTGKKVEVEFDAVTGDLLRSDVRH